MPIRRFKQRRPAVEGLELRDLPSVAPIYFARAAQAQATPGPAAPTPHELARRAFFAAFAGPYVTGPGRTTDQAGQAFITGGGNSNQFLHGNVQIGLFLPRDPNGPVTGQAALFDKNVSNTGNVLVLDLQGGPPPADGRPTRLTWTVDGSSGGKYSGATGQGTLVIRYTPGGRLPARANGAGNAGVIFRGQVDTTGVTDILRLG